MSNVIHTTDATFEQDVLKIRCTGIIRLLGALVWSLPYDRPRT